MTITQIAGKTGLSERIIRGDLGRLGIKPIGTLKQRPEQYPPDSETKIREARGLPANGETNGHANGADDGKIVSQKTLAKARSKARGK